MDAPFRVTSPHGCEDLNPRALSFRAISTRFYRTPRTQEITRDESARMSTVSASPECDAIQVARYEDLRSCANRADSDQLERSFRLDLSGRSDALERDRSEATGDWGQAGWV